MLKSVDDLRKMRDEVRASLAARESLGERNSWLPWARVASPPERGRW